MLCVIPECTASQIREFTLLVSIRSKGVQEQTDRQAGFVESACARCAQQRGRDDSTSSLYESMLAGHRLPSMYEESK